MKICLVLKATLYFTLHFIYRVSVACKLLAYWKSVIVVYYCEMLSKDLTIRVFFLKHSKIGIGYGKNITLAYFQSADVRQLILYFGYFLSTVLARTGWLENDCEHESGKCLFGMNLSFLYWFNWIKDFKWFIKSNSNIFKRKQFNFFHL